MSARIFLSSAIALAVAGDQRGVPWREMLKTPLVDRFKLRAH